MRRWQTILVVLAFCLAIAALSVGPPKLSPTIPERVTIDIDQDNAPKRKIAQAGMPQKPAEVTLPTPAEATPAAPLGTRAVTVIILVDRALLSQDVHDATLSGIANFMISTNETFKKEFGIEFYYSIVPWDYEAGKMELDMHQALIALDTEWSKGSSDIVIGATKRGLFQEACVIVNETNTCQKSYYGGFTYILGNAGVVSLNWTTPHALIHEFGHMLGATHSATDVPSIMSASQPLADFFDEKNKALIREHRMRTFRPPASP